MDPKKSNVIKKPTSISHDEAASLPIAVFTAYTGLIVTAKIDKSAKKVLIVGASGGVGIMGVQIAKKFNCHVTAVCSGTNEMFVKNYGADQVVDYKKGSLEEQFLFRDEFDVILDCVGGDKYWDLAQRILKPDGYFCTAVGPFKTDTSASISAIARAGMSVFWRKLAFSRTYSMIMNPAMIPDELKKWIEDGSIKPVVTHKFTLSDVEKAHELSRSHRARAKIILQISE